MHDQRAGMSEFPAPLRLAIFRVRRGTVCVVCGGRKTDRQCFCGTCYFSLPVAMRNQLYVRVTEARGQFEDAFLKALEHLVKEKKRYVPRSRLNGTQRSMIADTGLAAAMKTARKEANG